MFLGRFGLGRFGLRAPHAPWRTRHRRGMDDANAAEHGEAGAAAEESGFAQERMWNEILRSLASGTGGKRSKFSRACGAHRFYVSAPPPAAFTVLLESYA